MPTLDDIRVSLDLNMVQKKLHMNPANDLDMVRHLVNTVSQLIEPKAFYKVCYIEEKSEDSVVVEGMHLTSRVLQKNLAPVERIFPYAITLGAKLGERQSACGDLLENYYLDCIGNLALNSVQIELKKHLQSKYALEKMSSMAPGSLSDWPIEEQGPLFKILGDVETAIGLKLTRSLLMIPDKSISGIYLPTEVSFYSCQLCPRKRCEARKAKYNQALAEEYGLKK